MKKIYREFCGECPRFDDFRTIEIAYTEIWAVGQPEPQYLKTGYICDDSTACPCLNDRGYCRLYSQAPETP